MAFLSLFAGGRSAKAAPPPDALREPAALRSEAVFLPRRSATSETLPANTKLPSVLGAQPPTFARGREVAALLFWTLAVFLSLGLASYAGDPAIALGTPDAPVVGADWVGPVGAVVARAFVTLVGLAAWVVPLEAVLLGIPFVRGKKSNATPARLAGDILMVVIAAALIQVGWPGKLAFGRHPAGGMVGELFGELARSLFSTIGSFLVGFALLGLILIGRASFSFIALMRWIARVGRSIAERSAAIARRIADAWQRARALEREKKEQEKAEEAPHIALPAQDAITILGGDEDPAADDTDADRIPVTRMRLPTPSAPFPEESPLVIATPPEASERRPRRRKADAEPPIEEKAAADDASPPDAAPKRARKKRGQPKEEIAVEEAIEEASAADEGEASDDDAEDDDEPAAAPVALPVTPLDNVEVEAKLKKPRASAKKPAGGITIVDTSAALEKDAPAPPKPEEKKEREKKGAPAFVLPPLDMLVPAEASIGPMFDEAKLRANAELLVKTLADYKVTGKVEEILPGPVVTTFEVSPVAGTKVSKVAALADDLALALAKKVRIVAPIPGKNRIGFELPNDKRVAVNLRDLVEDRRFQTLDVPLPVVLGRDIVGNPVYADLASMPHAIVAGATGAGKSVGLNVMLTSLLFRKTPEELRMLMIDPKVVELAPYDRIPHMLLPVVTDMKQAATALKWAVDEMERRYQLFADAGTKNIGTYNAWVKRVLRGEAKNPLGKAIVGKDLNGIQEVLRVRDDDPEGEQQMPETLPMIVIVVDEFADLMMQQGKEVEAAVARLAQKARAAGMHVILATQRPSVDVITGMIKANFPTRIAYRVAQKIDSRTILDEQGAEHLLGRGDMLIKLNGTNETKRVQCPWVSEEEVQAVTDHLRAQGEPVYDENILKPRDDEAQAEAEDDGETDPMYDDAVRIVAETRRCSTSWLQRKLGLGYNRAARIVETMERRGLVGPANGSKDREVLIDAI
jgi:S-DNA-T family DNA segregation ATPase FtsK/SpoIIIE